MTFSEGPTQFPPLPDPLATPTAGNEVIDLLRQLLGELRQLHSMGELPSPAMFNLSPVDAVTLNGRVLLASHRIRMTWLVLQGPATSFTVLKGGNLFWTLAPTAASTGLMAYPWADVVDRGVSLQITSTAAGWWGYAIGTPE